VRARFWAIIDEARASGDCKCFSRVPANRHRLLEATAELMESVAHRDRPLMQSAALIRSRHPGRAQPNVNPIRIAVASQPAVEAGIMTAAQVTELVAIARSGIALADFRDLAGPVLDLSLGTTEEAADHEVLLDFYYEQAFLSRVLMFPPHKAAFLDESGELVLSPSFLVRVLGKKPRSILNLSSLDGGVNQRLRDTLADIGGEFEANSEGYATVRDVVLMMIESFVAMVTRPRDFDIDSITGIRLAMIVMDGDAAFFRWPVSVEAVGLQSTRIAGITVVATCCVFGAELSAVSFSHVTAAVKALHSSQLDSASFIRKEFAVEAEHHPSLQALLDDRLPEHSHLSRGHVDDFAAVEILAGRRPRSSAMDLAWAIQVFLGSDGLSDKKWRASSFWSDLQKVIGAWFDVTTFSLLMPRDKLESALDLLRSDEFAPHQALFSINSCASLEGKLRWATLATPLGSTGALINICKQRLLNNSSDRMVAPARFHRESPALALAKFHNELLIRKLFLEAAMLNPNLAACSMLSVLRVADRLKVPGESTMLVWLSGDFSMEGNSFGVEFWDAVLGYRREYCFVPHPAAVITALREALAGLSEKKGYAIVSSVCERQNKLMAEFQWRRDIAGRPCIVLEDNMPSVCCINTGYSSNVIMQAMQLASNLRQSVDECRSEAFYTTSKNMSFHDQVSRRVKGYVDRVNAVLEAAGMAPWVWREPSRAVLAIQAWLPMALEQQLPMLKELLADLEATSRDPKMPNHGLDPEMIAKPADLAWQDRVNAAAKDMPCEWGSFGPNSYNTQHLDAHSSSTGSVQRTYRQLCAASADTGRTALRAVDLLWADSSAALAAIASGLKLLAVSAKVGTHNGLAEQLFMGSVLPAMAHVRAQYAPTNLVITSSDVDCRPAFESAQLSGAHVVIAVSGHHAHALDTSLARYSALSVATATGFGQVFTQSVSMCDHGNASDVHRHFTVAFKASVRLPPVGFKFPPACSETQCAAAFLESSLTTPADLWQPAQYKLQAQRWCRHDKKVFVLGSSAHSVIWHPAGLYPARLDRSKSWVLALRLQALCPLHCSFSAWARASPSVGRLLPRRLSETEHVKLLGLPHGFPLTDQGAPDALPIRYMVSLMTASLSVLKANTEVQHASPRTLARRARQAAAAAANASPLQTLFKTGACKKKPGYSVLMDLNREQLAPIPISSEELLAMSLLQEALRFKHIEASKDVISMSVRHWRSFCRRFNLPFHLRCGSLELDTAAAAQGELFILYELSSFDIKAASVVEKLWAVGKEHEACRMQNPFRGNDILAQVTRSVCKLDGPPQPKIPLTDSTLGRIADALDFSKRESLVVWTGIRIAIAFLCRISEWGFNEKHSIRWSAVSFFDKNRDLLDIKCVSDLALIFELEITFLSDKTHNFGEGTCRSFFAIPDQGDTRCIARDLGRLWLLSEGCLHHHVFSWANDTDGPSRSKITAVLKAAAIQDGIPAADVCTHSLRVTGLSRLLAAGMPYESARTYGRWKSDCARRYWWPATSLAQDFSVTIWKSPTYARVRGGGAVQVL
jgi:hypothetical protein